MSRAGCSRCTRAARRVSTSQDERDELAVYDCCEVHQDYAEHENGAELVDHTARGKGTDDDGRTLGKENDDYNLDGRPACPDGVE